MYSGKNIYSRGRGRGRGRGGGGGGNYQNQHQGQGQGQGPGRCGGRGRGGNHSGFTDQQQRTTRSPIQENSGGFRGFGPPIQQYRQQLPVQGQRYGPKQEGAGPSSGRRGIWRERPWGPTPPLPSVPLQRARSTLDNLEIQALKISEQPASPAEIVENRIVPSDWGGTLTIQSILGSLLRTFLKKLILWLLYFAMLWISSM